MEFRPETNRNSTNVYSIQNHKRFQMRTVVTFSYLQRAYAFKWKSIDSINDYRTTGAMLTSPHLLFGILLSVFDIYITFEIEPLHDSFVQLSSIMKFRCKRLNIINTFSSTMRCLFPSDRLHIFPYFNSKMVVHLFFAFKSHFHRRRNEKYFRKQNYWIAICVKDSRFQLSAFKFCRQNE